MARVDLVAVADYFERIEHNPQNPETREAYDRMKLETRCLYNGILARGILVEFTPDNPYPTSEDLCADVLVDKRFSVYTGGELPEDHPLAETVLVRTKVRGSQTIQVRYNELFRAVHDFHGHCGESINTFGPEGEVYAFLSQVSRYSKTAGYAVAAETLAQNAFFNFGSHLRFAGNVPRRGEFGYVPASERPYAPQKAFAFKHWQEFFA